MTLIRDARVDTSPFLAAAMRGVDAARVVMGVRHGISQPLHHGDPVAEYWSLVDGVTLWDIASQRHVEVSGPDARAFVQSLVTRDLSGHEVGQAKYAFMTDADGRIVCDPVVLRLDDDRYWLTASASGVEGWCRAQADAAAADVTVSVPDAAAVQLQGPQAAAVMDDLFGDDLPTLGYHRFVRRRFDTVDLVIARTGWGGTDGFEVHVLAARRDGGVGAVEWWDAVMRAGERHGIVVGAPSHVARLEAGMPLHGADFDRATTPLEVGDRFGWMVDLDQPDDFVGRDALRALRRRGPRTRLVGVTLDGADLAPYDDGSIRSVGPVDEAASGRTVTLTSAVRSPRLRRNIGLLRVDADRGAPGERHELLHPALGPLIATVVPTPFLP